MRIAVLQFPGSNADWDSLHVARDVLRADARFVFHKETSLDGFDAAILPGGFSYGDYLRCGAIACFSPIIPALRALADRGAPVLGICNGFQILTELGLLPGTLARNAHLRFECRDVFVRVEASTPFTTALRNEEVLRLPIAHAEGRYHCDEATLARLERNQQIVFRYVSSEGLSSPDFPHNPNGSLENIAGVCNERRNVVGLMPHPERASESVLGNADGLRMFESLALSLRRPT